MPSWRLNLPPNGAKATAGPLALPPSVQAAVQTATMRSLSVSTATTWRVPTAGQAAKCAAAETAGRPYHSLSVWGMCGE